MSDTPAALAQIHQQSFPTAHAWSEQSFAELLSQPGVQLYQQDKQAFLLVRSAADEMEVLTIAVLPACRRQGLAKGLMQQALDAAEAANTQSCFLEVEAGNIPAIRLYKGLGFEVVATREGYYKTEHDGRRDGYLMRYRFPLRQGFGGQVAT